MLNWVFEVRRMGKMPALESNYDLQGTVLIRAFLFLIKMES